MASYCPNTCAWCKRDTWCERRHDGRPQCRGCKAVQFFRNALYAPLGLKLLGWQEKILRDLYGTVRLDDGLRQYRRAFISVAKKNGKSFLAGGLPLYHLLMDEEPRKEAYGAASSKDQAGIVFRSALHLLNGNPALKDRLRVVESTKRILRRDGGGFYAVLSADGDAQDGIEPSLAIRDETHRWKTAKADTLYDVLSKGTISRREPLEIDITTAGVEDESPIWVREHDYALEVLKGALQSSTFYPAVWSADAKRLVDEPEYWKSREARVAANPSHEDLGGFLKDSAIAAEMEKAVASPSERNKYFRYHLNVKVTANQEHAIDINRWYAAGGGTDLRTWPEYDVDFLIRQWGLLERPCYGGIDASWTIDLTAFSLLFPPHGDDDKHRLMLFYWMPADRVAERERKDRAPYSKWCEQGFIRAVPGDVLSHEGIVERVAWARQMFELRSIGFDRWNFRTTAMRIVDELGVQCADIDQNFRLLSEPTKKLLGMYLGGEIEHGNNPVLNWNAACLALQGDRKDNVQPAKPERMKSSKRIDGISATINALSVSISDETRWFSYAGLRSVSA